MSKRSNRLIKRLLIVVVLMLGILGIYKAFDLFLVSGKGNGTRTTTLKSIPIPNMNSYENTAYYILNNKERYSDYKKLNPKLSAKEIVWMVNAKLDYPFYTNIEVVDTKDETIIVNKYRQLPSDYVPELIQIQNGLLATSETTNAYHKMRDAMMNEHTGYDLQVISAYRSFTTQANLYNNYSQEYGFEEAETFSARPGHSEHQLGTALDVSSSDYYMSFGKTEEYKWIQQNAYKYGFIVSYQENNTHITGYIYEPWHIRYVGIEISTDMYDKNIKYLEEYIIKYVEKDQYK